MEIFTSPNLATGKFQITGAQCDARRNNIGNGHWAAYDESGELVSQGSGWSTAPTAAELTEWQPVAKQVAATMAGKWHMLHANIFIRFGNLPEGGRSMNHATGKREAGVSCFRATINVQTGAYELDGDGLPQAAIAAALGEYGHVNLLITGKCVGTGGDGEPVVRNVKTLAHLRYDESLGGYVEL